MEYYAIRIYRREVRWSGDQDAQVTGLLEDDAGHKEMFHSVEELWRLLVRSAPDGARGKPENDN
jgi:hypothetical protein